MNVLKFSFSLKYSFQRTPVAPALICVCYGFLKLTLGSRPVRKIAKRSIRLPAFAFRWLGNQLLQVLAEKYDLLDSLHTLLNALLG